MRFKSQQHKSTFKKAIRKKDKTDTRLMAAMYLLTADQILWNKVKGNIRESRIDYDEVRLDTVSEAEVLWMLALYGKPTDSKTADQLVKCFREDQTDKINITIQFDEERLTALQLYASQKNVTVEGTLMQTMESLYIKTVPQSVRDFIAMKQQASAENCASDEGGGS